jgi:exonuclease SbcD
MVLQYDNTRTRHNQETVEAENVENKTPMELVSEFFEKQNGQPMNEAQNELITNLINEIFA